MAMDQIDREAQTNDALILSDVRWRPMFRSSYGFQYPRRTCGLLAWNHCTDQHRRSWVANHKGGAAQPMPVDTSERWLLGAAVRSLTG